MTFPRNFRRLRRAILCSKIRSSIAMNLSTFVQFFSHFNHRQLTVLVCSVAGNEFSNCSDQISICNRHRTHKILIHLQVTISEIRRRFEKLTEISQIRIRKSAKQCQINSKTPCTLRNIRTNTKTRQKTCKIKV